ncbi:MAG: efflux RND transporter periplasmic adaptor subunit [Thermoflexales bacterium]|nr:efflux RND transporter periplasmic adaptor subunit [Thermoflexales bacterium]
MTRKRWITLIVLAALALLGAWWFLAQNPGKLAQLRQQWLTQVKLPAQLDAAPAQDGWMASGFIEAEQIAVATEIGGRIAALLVDEGEPVQAGDVLLRLEDDLLSAQLELEQARVEEARAALDQAKAGARPETVERFAAQVALAQAARDAALQAWLDAQAVRDNPQALNVEIAAAQAQLKTTQKQLEVALLQRDLAEKAWKDYGKGVEQLAPVPVPYRPAMPAEFYVIPYQWRQALAGAQAAQVSYDGARSALAHLLDQRSDPLQAQAQVDAAFAHYQSAEAAVSQAKAALEAVKAGATAEQIAAIEAQVQVAQAALEAAQIQLGKATLRAPADGVIVARSVYTGELAAPGIPALILADLDQVTLTIYVSGQRLGEMALGQAMDVYLDAFEGRAFPATVVHISDQAEYTPRNVRTSDQRASLVYGVKLKIPNPDHMLKPGLQAEAKQAGEASKSEEASSQAPSAGAGELRLDGVIEGQQARVVSEIDGRVVDLKADEGEAVQAGAVLARLDDAALQVQVKQAQAALGAAKANLAQIKACARSEDVAVARAALDKAIADREGARLGLENAQAILANPQQLLAQIDSANTSVKLAEQAVVVAQAKLAEARWWRDFYDDDAGRRESLDKEIAIAARELEAAQAQRDGTRATLGALSTMRRTPLALQAQVNNARSAYSMTLAGVLVAEAGLAEIEAAPRSEDIALVEAQLHQAQARLKLAQATLARAALRAPLTGLVASRSVHVGETIQPGLALMSIVDLEQVTLVVYVPQDRLPRVQLGAPAHVYVDAYPGEAFGGTVTDIAGQAQFSSRDTQAREDRANVVFAVKIRLPNLGHRLKAGMTADAVIETE